MRLIVWKIIFVCYALFVVVDLFSLPFQRPFIPSALSTLLGVIAAFPLFGYAFQKKIAREGLWRVLFIFHVVGVAIFLIYFIISHFVPFGGGTYVFSIAVTVMVMGAIFIIIFPWFRYAFRSPHIWTENGITRRFTG